MARRFPDHLDLVPGVDRQDPLDLRAEELPDYSSDEDDQGELEVDGPRPQFGSSDEEYWSDDFGSADEDWDWRDADSGYGSLSEEEEDEEEEEETEDEEVEEEEEEIEDDNYFARLWMASWEAPAQAVEPEGRAPTPSPQQRAERPSSRALLSDASHASPAPRPPPVGPALDFIPLSGCKRVRDEDEEDPSSKRPRLSSSRPGPSTSDPGPSTSDPGPSTSSGTSGGFWRHFHLQLNLHQDSESDED